MEKLIESETVELKETVTDNLKKEIIAFSNSYGGTIYVGVNDQGLAVGVKNTDGDTLRISNMIRDSIRPDITVFIHYQIIDDNGKKLIKVSVNQGTRKPYYLSSKGLRPEGVYVRQGSSSVPASEEAIRNMIIESDGLSYEGRRCLQTDLTFSVLNSHLDKKLNSHSTEVYRNLRIIQSETGEVSNLGLLLSDQNPFTVKLAVFDDSQLQTFRERKEFTGSLLKQMEDIIRYLTFINPLASTFVGIERIDFYHWPIEALREAVLNMLIHRDYSRNDSCQIRIDDQCIQFISIGSLPSGIGSDELGVGISVLRNPQLASVFYRLGYVEAFGIGIKKIKNLYKNQDEKPEFIPRSHSFSVCLPRQRKGKNDDKTINLKSLSNEKDNGTELNHKKEGHQQGVEEYSALQKQILKLLHDQGESSRLEMESHTGASRSMLIRELQILIKDRKIIRIGKGRNVKYLLSGNENDTDQAAKSNSE